MKLTDKLYGAAMLTYFSKCMANKPGNIPTQDKAKK